MDLLLHNYMVLIGLSVSAVTGAPSYLSKTSPDCDRRPSDLLVSFVREHLL